MSGTSGYIPSTPVRNSCEQLVIETVLVNPDTAILPTLIVGGLLKIEIDSNIGVVSKCKERIVGVVLVEPNKMDKLIDCIDGGTIYKGQIIELDPSNGVCRVRISAV